ncbi:hypothetical protein BUE80_DR003241 [Diplocarpon rosae]|nr:hypothetical protein BUE80_DR003241 [Diplocarpon rosae]
MSPTSSSGNEIFGDAKAGNAPEQMNENGESGMSAADKKPSRKRTKGTSRNPTPYLRISRTSEWLITLILGSRIAANLTADQLARKRASDRNAQQAARQRTRDYIEHLETRVEEINRQQVHLQDAKRRTGQLEAELEGLKEKLGKLEGKSGRLNWFFAVVLTSYLFPGKICVSNSWGDASVVLEIGDLSVAKPGTVICGFKVTDARTSWLHNF